MSPVDNLGLGTIRLSRYFQKRKKFIPDCMAYHKGVSGHISLGIEQRLVGGHFWDAPTTGKFSLLTMWIKPDAVDFSDFAIDYIDKSTRV